MRLLAFSLLALLTLSGCQSPYLSLMERGGVPKRQILVNRVEDARDAQIKARYQFNRALDRYRDAQRLDGPALQSQYPQLESDYQASEKAAAAIRPRIDTVEQIAEAMFDEWQGELGQYSSPALREASRQELEQTKAQYAELISRMRTADSRVLPALGALNDQMLFLKHSLNAKAVSGLNGSYSTVQGNVQPLLTDMQRSIDDANGFIQQLQRKLAQ